jgi:hypothetical protein
MPNIIHKKKKKKGIMHNTYLVVRVYDLLDIYFVRPSSSYVLSLCLIVSIKKERKNKLCITHI